MDKPSERHRLAVLLCGMADACEEWASKGGIGFANGWQFSADWLMQRGVRLVQFVQDEEADQQDESM